MKLLIDFFPILLFFAAFKMYGIYVATTVAIVATVLQIAEELGIAVCEKRITRDEVYTADEAFFTGTAAEVTPIRELDGRQIGVGHRGPLTAQIQAKYFDIVYGRSTQHDNWLAYI